MSTRRLQFRHGSNRAGLTLLETLLAVSIAALVVALVYASYHAAMSTLAGQQKRRGGRSAAVHALHAVARDLACALDAEGAGGSPFSLVEEAVGSAPFSSVSFCSAVRPDGEDDLEWFAIQRVTLRVAEGGHARRLVREHEPLVGPGAGAVQTNVLVEQVASFRVEAFDGENWVKEWPAEESGGGWPLAARISLSLAGTTAATGFSTQVWLPAAHVVTSRVERVGQRGAVTTSPSSPQ